MTPDSGGNHAKNAPEIRVIEADAPQGKIGFTVHENLGCLLGKASSKGDPEPLLDKDGLKDGMKVLTKSVFTGAWIELTVVRNKDGSFRGDSGPNHFHILGWQEGRGWCDEGVVNMKALKRLELYAGEER